VTVTTPTFRKYLSGVMWGLSLGTRLPNLKFVPSAVFELLALNAPKFTGSRDRDHAHFSEIFVRGHVGTIPGNTPTKFEVCTFSRFGTDGLTDATSNSASMLPRKCWRDHWKNFRKGTWQRSRDRDNSKVQLQQWDRYRIPKKVFLLR